MLSTQSHSSETKTKLSQSRLRTLTAIILVLLAAQFLVGVLVNLYVQVPAVHPGANAPEYFSGVVIGVAWALLHAPLWLQLHTIVGLLLFIASLLLIGFAIAARRRAWIILSIIGLLGIVAGGFNGASFMNYGHDFSSLLMSLGFLLAAIPYVIGLSLSH
ncbi:MAG TPA: hypothetical protein VNW73_03335 [Ktedonobacteraceae bacterium]|jgi:quinol-cytochrome oxidoreductase complex cytochrome b subunit|nr:hypothetical protein [Ktedonobacteraceae bacterium]